MKYKFDFFTVTIIFASIIFGIGAYLMVGYYQADEHVQIIEFANFKMGFIDEHELAWEYFKQIRPSFQPWFAFLIFKSAGMLKITDPYILTLVLRLITTVLAITSISTFVCAHWTEFTKYRKPFLFWSLFLWFIPVISIRFSSEIWSALFFMLALARVPKPEQPATRRAYCLIGIYLGLAFLCRFQSAIMSAGLLLWLIFVRKESIKNLLFIFYFGTFILLIGIFLDRLFYGFWTITAWNYFNVNLVEDVASNFGRTSWFRYLMSLIIASFIPIGLVLMAGYLLFSFRCPKDKVLWSTAPFLLIHLIIPHKEIRFLFPIAFYFPYIIFKVLESFNKTQGGRIPDKLKNPLSLAHYFFLLLNLILLGVAIFITPGDGKIAITKFIYYNYDKSKTQLYSLRGNNPFVPSRINRQSFYEIPELKQTVLNSHADLDTIQFQNGLHNLLVIRQRDLTVDTTLARRLIRLDFKQIKSGSPAWAGKLYSMYKKRAMLGEFKLYVRTKLPVDQ